jgi:hypothetical protein
MWTNFKRKCWQLSLLAEFPANLIQLRAQNFGIVSAVFFWVNIHAMAIKILCFFSKRVTFYNCDQLLKTICSDTQPPSFARLLRQNNGKLSFRRD